MRMPVNFILIFICMVFFTVMPAHAEINNAGIMDNVLERYMEASKSWSKTITAAASWLFWTLALISMVWTFGTMALKKADIGEFFAEFIRFTIFTGLFWWLLINGPDIASSLYDSFRQIASDATGLGQKFSPSGVVDIGFAIFYKVIDASSFWKPAQSAIAIVLSVVILVILAVISVNILILLCSAWILAYAGIFFLGFGGSRWTSDIAINYYKTILSVSTQLMSMVFLIGIGKTFLDDYYSQMSSGGVHLKEMGIMLIVTLVLLILTTRLPSLIAGIINGSSIGVSAGMSTSNATGIASAAAVTSSAAIAAGAASATGEAKTIMTAFSKVGEFLNSGADAPSSTGGTSNNNGAGSTPFAEAAGFSGSMPSNGEVRSMNTDSNAGSNQTSDNTQGSDAKQGNQQQEQEGKSGSLDTASKADRTADDAGANLAKGAKDDTSAQITSTKQSANEQITDTAIKGQSDNSISDQLDSEEANPESEIAAFCNRNAYSPFL